MEEYEFCDFMHAARETNEVHFKSCHITVSSDAKFRESKFWRIEKIHFRKKFQRMSPRNLKINHPLWKILYF